MAAISLSAPLRETSALVAEPQFQDVVLHSRTAIERILFSIPDVHKSCIISQALQLNSSENAKLEWMAIAIRIKPASVLRAVSENFTLETSLRVMSEGLQLHRDYLEALSPHLAEKDKVTDLMTDIRDLDFQINKMLKMLQGESQVQPTPTPVTLHLPANYEVQVATHLTLVQLQSFGQDIASSLRVLDQNNDEEEEETES